MTAYSFGDVVLVGFPHTNLQGVAKRPTLILYDSGDQDILVARVTAQEYTTEADYKIAEWEKSGLLAESLANRQQSKRNMSLRNWALWLNQRRKP